MIIKIIKDFSGKFYTTQFPEFDAQFLLLGRGKSHTAAIPLD
jgi:hypothetical protein